MCIRDRYCVWAEKVNIGKKISNLYIAEMKSPTELASTKAELAVAKERIKELKGARCV